MLLFCVLKFPFSDKNLYFMSHYFQELYNDCDKLRQTVFKLATETEDDDSSLGKAGFILLFLICFYF